MAIAAQRGLPIPPMPVMPPGGIAPVTNPDAISEGDQASPTSMVLKYLAQRGYTPSTENVRRALEANQTNPGVIPGLVSDRPATDEEDQAAMAAARGAGGGAAKPWVNPPMADMGKVPNAAEVGWKPTPDNTASGSGGGIGAAILSGLASVGLPAAALYGMNRFLGKGSPETSAPPEAPLTGQPGPNETIDYTKLPAQGNNLLPPQQPGSDMEQQMQRATEPAKSPFPGVRPVGQPGGMDTTPPMGPTEPVAPMMPPRGDGTIRVAPTAEDLAQLQRDLTMTRGGKAPALRPRVRVPAPGIRVP